MENHHFQWENPLFQWAIFHCYVKLPEGKPPFSYGFPIKTSIFGASKSPGTVIGAMPAGLLGAAAVAGAANTLWQYNRETLDAGESYGGYPLVMSK